MVTVGSLLVTVSRSIGSQSPSNGLPIVMRRAGTIDVTMLKYSKEWIWTIEWGGLDY